RWRIVSCRSPYVRSRGAGGFTGPAGKGIEAASGLAPSGGRAGPRGTARLGRRLERVGDVIARQRSLGGGASVRRVGIRDAAQGVAVPALTMAHLRSFVVLIR